MKIKLNIDAIAFTLISFLCLAIWWCVYGWDGSFSLTGADAHYSFPRLVQLVEAQGDWSKLLYRFDIFGGALVSPIWGAQPFFSLLASLGFDAFFILNATVVFLQVLYAFFFFKCILGMFQLFEVSLPAITASVSDNLKNYLFPIILSLIVSFHPLLSARLVNGHLDLMFATLLFLVFFAVILNLKLKQSLLFWVLSCIAMVFAFSGHGHQMKLYSFVFALPIYLTCLLIQKKSFKNTNLIINLGIFSLISLLAFLFSSSSLMLMLKASNSGDSPRALQESLIYSYSSAEWTDWLHSLFIKLHPDYIYREKIFWHEVLYPIGFIFLLLPMAWANIQKKIFCILMIGILASGFLAINFSFKDSLASLVLSTILPVIKAFRVPERAIYPALFSMIILSATYLAHKTKPTWGVLAFLIGLVMARVSYGEPVWFSIEIILLTIVLLAEVFFYFKKKQSQIFRAISISITVFLIFSGFHDWMIHKVPKNELFTLPQNIGSQFKAQIPNWTPLSRFTVQAPYPVYGINTALAYGLSSFEGYWVPTRRLSELFAALLGQEYNPTRAIFGLTGSQKIDSVLIDLYNIKYAITLQNNNLSFQSVKNKDTPAWFVESLESSSSWRDLVQSLINFSSEGSFFQKAILLKDEKILNRNILLAKDFSGCEQSNLNSVMENKSELTISYKASKECLLVVSANYVSLFKGILNNKTDLEVFPINGSLTGVLVPPGDNEIKIFAKSNVIPFLF